MPRYLIVLSNDDGEDCDSGFVEDCFDHAVELFIPGVWVVKTRMSAEEIAKFLGVAEGEKRDDWSSLIVPLKSYFGFMSKEFVNKLSDLKSE